MIPKLGLSMPARLVSLPQSISDAAKDRLAAYDEIAAEPEWPSVTDLSAWRSAAQSINARMVGMLRPYVATCRSEVKSLLIGSVPVQVSRPMIEHHPGAVYLDIHGGGFTCFGGECCNMFGRLLSERLGVTVYSPDYRLPPDWPYPAGLEDAFEVYAYLVEHFRPDTIVVGGQSTGGNIALSLILKAKTEGLALPAGLVLLTPHIDLTESGDSFQVLRGIDPGLPYGLAGANRLYADQTPLDDPGVSPLFAKIDPPFPRTFLQAGTRDLLLSNAVRLHRRMIKARTLVELHIYDGMPHGGFGASPEDADVDDDLRHFLDHVLKP